MADKGTRRLSLGLDSSTQSLTAVIIDIDKGETVLEHSLDYAKDSRLNKYGIDYSEYLIPPRVPGEADQPPKMYLASLDALFSDLVSQGLNLSEVVVINTSGQQHGHLYLNESAGKVLASLHTPENLPGNAGLSELCGEIFSYGSAPIWRTANTVSQAEDLRKGAGGKDQMVALSGSDSPLRFTGAVVRRVGQQFPEAYKQTETLQLISSFIPAVLAGNHRVPMDYGNGAGTSLMDYSGKMWSEKLIAAAAEGLPGGTEALKKKLPELVAPDTIVGSIAAYFQSRYGFSKTCRIAAGSGDNPQTKVLVKGDLLSLGTSFVNMVSTEKGTVDKDGYANAMYDGLGRAFMFGCRTNGAMVWDRVRSLHGIEKSDYATGEEALRKHLPGSSLFFWKPETESFPVSKSHPPMRIGYTEKDLVKDYGGIIDSSLAGVYLASEGFARPQADVLYVTGGATSSPEIMRRISAIWGRKVVTIGKVGAGLGTAVSGAVAYLKDAGEEHNPESISASVLPRGEEILPAPGDVEAYNKEGGYLDKARKELEKLL